MKYFFLLREKICSLNYDFIYCNFFIHVENLMVLLAET